MDTIYVEDEIRDHPRVLKILARHPKSSVVSCERYSEVFNVRAQNFRLQKKRPALILAKKHGKFVLPTPPDYSIGAAKNVYFSHMLNCLYDCRYCFLQGMYQSANYVHFVNAEDYQTAIREEVALVSEGNGPTCFFSGYDCDSLALESLTGFAAEFAPFFQTLDPEKAWLELRTKSVNISPILALDPTPNIITAFSLTPDSVARKIEHGAAPIKNRINSIRSLTQQGWNVGLRLDPLISSDNFEAEYRELLEQIFAAVADVELVHSVTVGPLRFPTAMYDKIARLYPEEPMLADFSLVENRETNRVSYDEETEARQEDFVVQELLKFMPANRIFRQEDS